MKPGFMLLQLLLVTAVAGILFTGLIVTISNIARVQRNLNGIVGVSVRAATLNDHLERDLMGVFLPVQVDQTTTDTAKQNKDADQDAKQEKEGKDKNDTKGVQEDSQDSDDKEMQPVMRIDKPFYAESEDGRLSLLTFITANPRAVYVGTKVGTIKPRLARVVYRIDPDATRPGLFIIKRQESPELNFTEYDLTKGTIPAFEMIDEVYSVRINFLYSLVPTSTDPKQEKPEKKEYKAVSQWPLKKEESKESEDVQLPVVPDFVEVTLAVRTWGKDRETFMIEVPVGALVLLERPKERKEFIRVTQKPGGKQALIMPQRSPQQIVSQQDSGSTGQFFSKRWTAASGKK